MRVKTLKAFLASIEPEYDDSPVHFFCADGKEYFGTRQVRSICCGDSILVDGPHPSIGPRATDDIRIEFIIEESR